ncbi:hypothetical protein C8U37_12222 [Trichococcus patagoniensis]|uniref:Uncharacterized protein n=1 Tax=Trichococcus patagoniensis TaxID=382641 RepID=A0A2T5IC64_9LACT|nr:hypothetical protein C8U37_12222 [Trichococcus patagoniensis]
MPVHPHQNGFDGLSHYKFYSHTAPFSFIFSDNDSDRTISIKIRIFSLTSQTDAPIMM